MILSFVARAATTCRQAGLSPFVAYAGRKEEGGSREGPRPSLGDPVQTVSWGGQLPSQRRAVLGGLAGLGIGAPSQRPWFFSFLAWGSMMP